MAWRPAVIDWWIFDENTAVAVIRIKIQLPLSNVGRRACPWRCGMVTFNGSQAARPPRPPLPGKIFYQHRNYISGTGRHRGTVTERNIHCLCFRHDRWPLWRRVAVGSRWRLHPRRPHWVSEEGKEADQEDGEGQDCPQWKTTQHSQDLLQCQPQARRSHEGQSSLANIFYFSIIFPNSKIEYFQILINI